MRTVAVYPGRFHPFSLGHKAVYDHLANDPAIDDVYVVTSAKQDSAERPFSIDDKKTMMTKIGIPPGRIIQVKNPYKIEEIITLLGLDPEQDRLIYALGADDAKRFNYTPDSALQLLSKTKNLKPVGQHAYVKLIPRIPYQVLGQRMERASQIRKAYVDGNDNDRDQIIADLYGKTDPDLRAMFDRALGINAPQEGIIYGQERVYAGDQPVSIMREERLACLRENILFLQDRIQQLRNGLDYIDEKWTRKYKKSINCANPKGFSQKAHCAARRKRARGGSTKSKPVK